MWLRDYFVFNVTLSLLILPDIKRTQKHNTSFLAEFSNNAVSLEETRRADVFRDTLRRLMSKE